MSACEGNALRRLRLFTFAVSNLRFAVGLVYSFKSAGGAIDIDDVTLDY